MLGRGAGLDPYQTTVKGLASFFICSMTQMDSGGDKRGGCIGGFILLFLVAHEIKSGLYVYVLMFSNTLLIFIAIISSKY
jgi:hypothetical protein